MNECMNLPDCTKRVLTIAGPYPEKERKKILAHFEEFKKKCVPEKRIGCKYQKMLGY